MKNILTIILSTLLLTACGGGSSDNSGSSSSSSSNGTSTNNSNTPYIQSFRNNLVGKWYFCIPAYSGLSYFGYLEFTKESGLRENFEGVMRDYRKLTSDPRCEGVVAREFILHTDALYQITNSVKLSGNIDGIRFVFKDTIRGDYFEHHASIIENTKLYFVKQRSDGSITTELNYDIELKKSL